MKLNKKLKVIVMAFLISVPLQAKQERKPEVNPSNPKKYQGFDYGVGGFDKLQSLTEIGNKYNNVMQPLRDGMNNIQSYTDMGKDFFSKNYSLRNWRKVGRFNGAVNDRFKTMQNSIDKWSGNTNFGGGVGTNVFVVHITSKVIVPPLVKIAKKAISEVENNINNAIDKAIGKRFQNFSSL